jgi:hypothetical protein
VDQWWGALTQQFQTIASDAMKDVARQAAQIAPQRTTAMMAEKNRCVGGGDSRQRCGGGYIEQTAIWPGAAAIGKGLR